MKVPTDLSVEIEYPSSDGEPRSENQWQLDAMIDAINVLRTHFADCPGVYVSGDLPPPPARVVHGVLRSACRGARRRASASAPRP